MILIVASGLWRWILGSSLGIDSMSTSRCSQWLLLSTSRLGKCCVLTHRTRLSRLGEDADAGYGVAWLITISAGGLILS